MNRRDFAKSCVVGAFTASSIGVKGALAAIQFHPGIADRVVVVKHLRKLFLMRGPRIMQEYRVALGRYPKGDKVREGDARTPEGLYTLDYKLEDSAFYRAIHISYPDANDIARAEALGVSPGGQIMIHGLPNNKRAVDVGHPTLDWTQGCIAVTNQEIEEIWASVVEGTPIEIIP